jgi:D-3-phosphoglycerate dehydrogenase
MDILITEEIDAPALQRLGQKYEVVRDATLWKDPARLEKQIRDARVVVVRNQTQLTADLLEAAPKLLGIGRVGVGLDNIALDAAARLGLVVVAPLEANAVSVAELTMGFVLALARKIPLADRSTRTGGWDRKGCTGMELNGKTLAICGYGRIGRQVAHRARAFGMRVLAYDPFLKRSEPETATQEGITFCGEFGEALAGGDFLTAHLPLTPQTSRIFDQRAFSTMKQGSFFINTSRGGIVEEAALLDALRNAHLAGAALDVREIEPPSNKSGFELLDNVILTPHIGSFTHEAQTRTIEAVSSDMDRLLRGDAAVHFVNFPRPTRLHSA